MNLELVKSRSGRVLCRFQSDSGSFRYIDVKSLLDISKSSFGFDKMVGIVLKNASDIAAIALEDGPSEYHRLRFALESCWDLIEIALKISSLDADNNYHHFNSVLDPELIFSTNIDD